MKHIRLHLLMVAALMAAVGSAAADGSAHHGQQGGQAIPERLETQQLPESQQDRRGIATAAARPAASTVDRAREGNQNRLRELEEELLRDQPETRSSEPQDRQEHH